MYYHEAFFDQTLSDYLREQSLDDPDEIVPNDFVQWAFPKLIAHRRPLYEDIATRHGYIIEAEQAETIYSEEDFIRLIADTIDSQ